MIVQRIWAFFIGTASTVVGILRILSINSIPWRDGIVHVVSGLLFIAGALIRSGRYVNIFNILLGVFYMAYGAFYLNWDHSTAGLISCLIGLFFRGRKMELKHNFPSRQ